MAIKGLTDRNLSFPEIGQIRKGGKKTQPDRPGPDLTYFRCEFDEREVEAAKTFLERYGAQPTEINIILPFNEIDRMWDAWLEAYTAGRMVARSDGEKFTYLVDTGTGAILVKGGIDVKTGQPRPYIEGQPVGTWHNQKTNRDEPIFCKPTGRLKVVIPELGRAAYLTVMTTSVHDIGNISAQLNAFQQINGGRIAGIPLVLRRRPKKISTPSADGSRARRVKWMLSIEADPDWVKRMLTEVKRLALPGNGLALLPEGGHEEPEEDVTREEFDEPEDFEDGDFRDQADPPAETTIVTVHGEIPNPGDLQSMPPQPEDPPAEIQQTANVNGNGNRNSRPYPPEKVKQGLAEAIARHANENANDKQKSLAFLLLDQMFQGDQDKRHTLLLYLTGDGSWKKITGPQALAFLDWLKPNQDSGGAYTVGAYVEAEAQAIVTQALKQEGQQTLF